MSNEDFPFVQKRFLEEYAAWTAVEMVELPKLLSELPRLKQCRKRQALRSLPSTRRHCSQLGRCQLRERLKFEIVARCFGSS
jgi:hypothetical protein